MNHRVKVLHKHPFDVPTSLRSYPQLYEKEGILVNHNCRQVFIENDNGCLEIVDMELIVEMREVVDKEVGGKNVYMQKV